MTNTDQHLTTAQLAAQLGVNVRTIHRRVERGELTPAIKFPGLRGGYLFDPTSIDTKDHTPCP